MSLSTRVAPRLRRSRALLAVSLVVVAALAAACTPDPPPPAPGEVCDAPTGSSATAVAVMGRCPRVSIDQMVAWFENYPGRPTYRALVPIRDLVTFYVEEGNAEGVRGDIAFTQAILETGWFSSTLTYTKNNFSGIGAVDTDPIGGAATFPDARTGVRAQIQHLRAYADATATTCTVPPLHNPCVDPRFHLVSPKGKAPTWNQYGNGVWATSPTYATSILTLYTKLLTKYGLTLA